MTEVSRTTFTVTPTGIGRKDYSQNVEYSVEPLVRSHQRRVAWQSAYYLWTLPYSLVTYWQIALLQIQADGSLTYQLYFPLHYTEFFLATTANRLARIEFAEYNTFADVAQDTNRVRTFGGAFGYGLAKVTFAKPVEGIPGRYYGGPIAVYDPAPFGTVATYYYSHHSAIEDEIVGGP